MVKPKASIVCWTYNQKDFIAQTIESFIMQQASFSFEVVIHDDASTDGTTGIIQEYEKKYPDIIKPIYQKVNQFSGGTSAFINQSLNTTQGAYIALCEGDDYWTDPKKLQRQVDFLEKNLDYALCFHPVKVVFENGEKEDTIFPEETLGFTVKELLRRNFIQTNSVMYRRQNYENLAIDIMPRDWYLHLYHASFGKIGFINKAMSVYRRHAGGIWWDQHKAPTHIWEKYGYSFLRLLHEIMQLYGTNSDYKKIIDQHIAGSYEAISAIKPEKLSDEIAIKSIEGMPSEAWGFMKQLMQQASHYSDQIPHLERLIESEKATNEILSNELKNIRSSKAWKAMLAVRAGSYSARHPVSSAKRIVRNKNGMKE